MDAGRQACAVVHGGSVVMKTPAWRRFLSEWGTFAVVMAMLTGMAYAAYLVLAKGD